MRQLVVAYKLFVVQLVVVAQQISRVGLIEVDMRGSSELGFPENADRGCGPVDGEYSRTHYEQTSI